MQRVTYANPVWVAHDEHRRIWGVATTPRMALAEMVRTNPRLTRDEVCLTVGRWRIYQAWLKSGYDAELPWFVDADGAADSPMGPLRIDIRAEADIEPGHELVYDPAQHRVYVAAAGHAKAGPVRDGLVGWGLPSTAGLYLDELCREHEDSFESLRDLYRGGGQWADYEVCAILICQIEKRVRYELAVTRNAADWVANHDRAAFVDALHTWLQAGYPLGQIAARYQAEAEADGWLLDQRDLEHVLRGLLVEARAGAI